MCAPLIKLCVFSVDDDVSCHRLIDAWQHNCESHLLDNDILQAFYLVFTLRKISLLT